MDLTTQASHFLVRPAVDGDFVICRNTPCGQVLVLPSRCLVRPAADDDKFVSTTQFSTEWCC